MDGWIVIPNWDRFQHYKNRNPPWIKLYTNIGADPDYVALTLAEQGLLVRIWCEYARSNGSLSVTNLRRLVTDRALSKHLRSLNHAGLVEVVAAKPAASSVLAPADREEVTEKNGPANAEELKVPVDEAMLELARGWLELNPQRLPA